MSSFTYQSTDFGGASYNVYVTGAGHQRMPQPRVNIDAYAQADGAAVQGSTYDPASISIECKLVGATAAARVTQMNNFIGKLSLSQSVGGSNLSIDMLPGNVWTNARLTSDISAIVRARMEAFTLTFTADSWPAAASESELGDTSASGTGVTTV
jgi:hypothetical protein